MITIQIGELLRAIPELTHKCVWTFSDANDSEVWESACGETWQFIDGGPSENKARFCHGCGGLIVLAKPSASA